VGGVAIEVGDAASAVGGVAIEVGGVGREVGDAASAVGGVESAVGGVGREVGGVAIEVGGVAIEVGGVAIEVGDVAIEVGDVAIEVGGVANEVGPLSTRRLAMCGVCAGKQGDVGLGDVIIADRVLEYDTGKRRVDVVEGKRVEHDQGDIEMHRLHPPPWKQARLSESVRKVLGVEMEAAAIRALAWAKGLEYSVVMKGEMDHADGDRRHGLPRKRRSTSTASWQSRGRRHSCHAWRLASPTLARVKRISGNTRRRWPRRRRRWM
jgi:hypothetical protein